MNLTVEKTPNGKTLVSPGTDYVEPLKDTAAKLLAALLEYPNRFTTYNTLSNKIWGVDTDQYKEGSIRVHLNRVRNFLREVETEYEILTVSGRGLILITESNE
jgi:DNA-binding response OmpR family regulator